MKLYDFLNGSWEETSRCEISIYFFKLSLLHWLGPHDLTHPRQCTDFMVPNKKSSNKDEGWHNDKETRTDAKRRSVSKLPTPTQGRKETGVPSSVCYFGHMWLIACHTVRRTQTPSNRHTWQVWAPKQGLFLCKMCWGMHCVCIYIERIPATCIRSSRNTDEISLSTHTPKLCVCVYVCFPISFSKQLWKLLYCPHSNRKGSGKCLMRGRCDKRDRAVKQGNLGNNKVMNVVALETRS